MNKHEARRRRAKKRKARKRRADAIERRWLRWNRKWDGGPPYNIEE